MTMDADGSMAMVYTTEQQARLHVDVFGVCLSSEQEESFFAALRDDGGDTAMRALSGVDVNKARGNLT
eukprot:COSAG06_NODE_62841_length_264_cov_0.581818_1_plen_67_part_01